MIMKHGSSAMLQECYNDHQQYRVSWERNSHAASLSWKEGLYIVMRLLGITLNHFSFLYRTFSYDVIQDVQQNIYYHKKTA